MEVIEAMMEVCGARIDGSGSLSVQLAEGERTARARMAATQSAARRGDLGASATPHRSSSNERAVAARLTCAELTVAPASDPGRTGAGPTICSVIIQDKADV
jgi:hypothetical protein